MMSNDCARATPPKPPSTKLNMKTITTARCIKSLLFVPNSAWLPREFIALPQKALQSNTSPEGNATRASHQTRAAPSGLPRSFGGVMLAKLGALAASKLCGESVESGAANGQEPRPPYTATNGCLRRIPSGAIPVHCSPGVSRRAKPEPRSEQFAERTHSPGKLCRCLASRQKALLEGRHVPTGAQLRAQGRSRALLQRRTRWLGRNPRSYGGLGRHEEGRDGIRQGAGGVARKGAHPGGGRADYAARY